MINTVNYFVVAEDAIRGEDGALTIVKVFNRLRAKKVPLVKPKITLAFGFFPPEGSAKSGTLEIEVRLQVVDPDNNTVLELTANRKRPKSKHGEGLERELTSFVDLSDNLILPKFGIYKIKLWCQDTLLAENRFEVAKK